MNTTTKYKRTPKGVLAVLYSKMKERTKQKRLPQMDFSLQDLQDMYLADHRFLHLHEQWIKSNFDKYKKPSIDRKNPLKGYTKDNIQLMTWKENRLKGEKENTFYSTPIIMFDQEGRKLAEFESMKFAVDITGLSQGNISACCQGKRNHTGGYRFKYRGDKFRKKPELMEAAL